MKHAIEAFVVVALGLLLTAAVEAQETPAPAPQPVTVRPGLIVTDQDAFAVYVTSTTINEKGQFAGVELWVIGEGGPQRLTLCDDLVVPCNPITVRMDGIHQGEGFALVGE